MKIVSFATENHVGLENLKLSLSKVNGWEHTIIGLNTKWKGWITRMQAYRDFCKNLENQNEIIVFSDAYDVLCLQSSETFLELYQEFANDKIIIGAEIGCAANCFPPTQWWSENDIQKDAKRKFVNGGLIAGSAKMIGTMWEWAIEQKFDDDQIALGHYTNTYPDLIFLDVNSLFFFNDHDAVSSYDIKEDNSLIENGKALKPFFIHFHGLNIHTSVPFTNSKKTLFEVGKNYKKVGAQINGDDHITSFPPDYRSSNLGIWVERSGFFLLFFIFLFVLFALIIYKNKH